MTDKVSVALMQGSSCWGCFQSLIDIHLRLAEVLPMLDIKFWAAVADFKHEHLEGYPDKSIDVGLYEGAARTEEDIHHLKLMREKCKTLISFGSCSCFGGIPGLANFSDIEECYDVKFRSNKTVKDGKVPTENVPPIAPVIKPNNQYVDFDVYLPGCPPTSDLIFKALTTLIKGDELVLDPHTVCHYCNRDKQETPIPEILRPFDGNADPDRCLLEQGYICMGSATWGLCEGQCVNKGATCRGCFGPPPPIMQDQGANGIGMLGSYAPLEPEVIQDAVRDPLGLFWRFSYATSHLGSMRIRREEAKNQ
ncbi:F420-nonreducing hydrogenase [Candidatus Thorarchaeota archaeon]|nr:MAG: F420-nonreducing hydrogenase [Candidatus Thorarchaeota archaeon]